MQPSFSDVVNIGPYCIERFIDNSNAPEISDLHIELAGCSNLSGDYVVGRVTPPNHTLFYSLKGSGVLYGANWNGRACRFKHLFLRGRCLAHDSPSGNRASAAAETLIVR